MINYLINKKIGLLLYLFLSINYSFASENLCQKIYSSKSFKDNLIDKISASPHSQPSYLLFQNLEESLATFNSQYRQTISLLHKNGSNNVLASAIETTNILLARVSPLVDQLEKIIDKKNSNSLLTSKESALKEQLEKELTGCKSTTDACILKLNSALEDFNDEIVHVNKILSDFDVTISSLLDLKSFIFGSDFSLRFPKIDRTGLDRIIDDKIESLKLNRIVLEKFISLHNSNFQTAIGFLNSEIPNLEQRLLNLDAAGANIGFILDSTNAKQRNKEDLKVHSKKNSHDITQVTEPTTKLGKEMLTRLKNLLNKDFLVVGNHNHILNSLLSNLLSYKMQGLDYHLEMADIFAIYNYFYSWEVQLQANKNENNQFKKGIVNGTEKPIVTTYNLNSEHGLFFELGLEVQSPGTNGLVSIQKKTFQVSSSILEFMTPLYIFSGNYERQNNQYENIYTSQALSFSLMLSFLTKDFTFEKATFFIDSIISDQQKKADEIKDKIRLNIEKRDALKLQLSKLKLPTLFSFRTAKLLKDNIDSLENETNSLHTIHINSVAVLTSLDIVKKQFLGVFNSLQKDNSYFYFQSNATQIGKLNDFGFPYSSFENMGYEYKYKVIFPLSIK